MSEKYVLVDSLWKQKEGEGNDWTPLLLKLSNVNYATPSVIDEDNLTCVYMNGEHLGSGETLHLRCSFSDFTKLFLENTVSLRPVDEKFPGFFDTTGEKDEPDSGRYHSL